MRAPVIVVSGGIASGKTTIAAIIAARGGAIVDCDSLARRALHAAAVKQRLVRAFGRSVLTRAGNLSRTSLRSLVFSSDDRMTRLNEIVRPSVTRIVENEVRRLRGKAPYIVLDAVLFFHYTFKFKVDLTVVTEASTAVRVGRLMKRDGLTRSEAKERIERQGYLADGWKRADRIIRTDGAVRAASRAAEKLRDDFLEERGIARRKRR